MKMNGLKAHEKSISPALHRSVMSSRQQNTVFCEEQRKHQRLREIKKTEVGRRRSTVWFRYYQ